jgi:glycosidase
LWNFLDTHDTERVRTRAGGSVELQKAAAFFQFTFPGSPILYYGDELAMEGADDPFCRFPMPWEKTENHPMLKYYSTLASLRREYPALRRGSFRTWQVEENGLYAYLRQSDDQQVLCLINTALEPVSGIIPLPEEMAGAAALTDLYADVPYPVQDGRIKVTLAVGEGAILALPE